MCGENALETVRANWLKYAQVLLGQQQSSDSVSEEDQFKALEVIDSKLRPNGPGAKAQSAFAVYKVHNSYVYILSIGTSFTEKHTLTPIVQTGCMPVTSGSNNTISAMPLCVNCLLSLCFSWELVSRKF